MQPVSCYLIIIIIIWVSKWPFILNADTPACASYEDQGHKCYFVEKNELYGENCSSGK